MLDGERFLKHLPSMIAASCVYVSLHTLGFGSCVSVIPILEQILLTFFILLLLCGIALAPQSISPIPYISS